LKIFKLDSNYKIKNTYKIFNSLKTRDWIKLPKLLQDDFLEYRINNSDELESKLVSDLLNFKNLFSFYISNQWLNEECLNKYITEHLIYIITQYKNLNIKTNNDKIFAHIRTNFPNFLNKKRIMKIICSIDGGQLQYFNEKIKDDYKIAMIACSNNFRAFEFVSDRLRDNDKIYLAAIDNANKYTSNRNTPWSPLDTIIKSVSKKFPCSNVCSVFNFSSIRIKDNKRLVKFGINLDPMVLLLASENLKNDKSLVMRACEKNGNVILLLPEKYKKDVAVMTLCWLENKEIVKHVHKKIKKVILRQKGNIKISTMFNFLNNKKLDKIMYRQICNRKFIPRGSDSIRKFRV